MKMQLFESHPNLSNIFMTDDSSRDCFETICHGHGSSGVWLIWNGHFQRGNEVIYTATKKARKITLDPKKSTTNKGGKEDYLQTNRKVAQQQKISRLNVLIWTKIKNCQAQFTLKS